MKIKYILGFFIMAFIFASCESPMKDIYDDLDKQDADNDKYAQNYVGKALAGTAYTLTDDDYKLSANENVANYKNFSSSAPAEENLAEILDQIFYAAVTAEMTVTFNYYEGMPDYLPSGAVESYELETADYDAMGEDSGEPGRYDNFSSSTPPEDYLPDFMATKYPDAVNGDGYFITYDYYSGGVSARSDYYEFDGTTWAATSIPNSYILTGDDYDSMGDPGAYDNFSSGAKPEDYLPTFLSIRFPYAVEGDTKIPVYKYYAGGGVTETRMDEYKFDGSVWTKTVSVVQKSLLFAYDGLNWAFVPPIKFVETTKAFTVEYTVTPADFDLVGNGKYNNFDIRAGKGEESIDVRIAKITTILKANFDVALGDVYSVTYAIYDGGDNTPLTIVLEAVEDVK